VPEISTENWIAGDWVESESRGTIGLTLHAPFGGSTDPSTNTYRERGDAGLGFITSMTTPYDRY